MLRVVFAGPAFSRSSSWSKCSGPPPCRVRPPVLTAPLRRLLPILCVMHTFNSLLKSRSSLLVLFGALLVVVLAPPPSVSAGQASVGDPTPDGVQVVARVAGEPVTLEDVDAVWRREEPGVWLQNMPHLYQARLGALQIAVAELVLSRRAAAEDLDLESYIVQAIDRAAVPPTEAELAQAVREIVRTQPAIPEEFRRDLAFLRLGQQRRATARADVLGAAYDEAVADGLVDLFFDAPRLGAELDPGIGSPGWGSDAGEERVTGPGLQRLYVPLLRAPRAAPHRLVVRSIAGRPVRRPRGRSGTTRGRAGRVPGGPEAASCPISRDGGGALRSRQPSAVRPPRLPGVSPTSARRRRFGTRSRSWSDSGSSVSRAVIPTATTTTWRRTPSTLFADQSLIPSGAWHDLARRVGANPSAFADCGRARRWRPTGPWASRCCGRRFRRRFSSGSRRRSPRSSPMSPSGWSWACARRPRRSSTVGR